jgi:transposase-like protein
MSRTSRQTLSKDEYDALVGLLNLRRHTIKITDCPYCGKSDFYNKSQIMLHIESEERLLHSGYMFFEPSLQSWVCTLCNLTFEELRGATKHLQSHLRPSKS